MENKESFHRPALRALMWAAILTAVAVFWAAVGLVLVSWVR